MKKALVISLFVMFLFSADVIAMRQSGNLGGVGGFSGPNAPPMTVGPNVPPPTKNKLSHKEFAEKFIELIGAKSLVGARDVCTFEIDGQRGSIISFNSVEQAKREHADILKLNEEGVRQTYSYSKGRFLVILPAQLDEDKAQAIEKALYSIEEEE